MATNDSFVQVAPDSSGKKMETALVTTQGSDASTGARIEVQRQRAEITGSVEDALQQLVKINKLQTRVLQGILLNLNTISNINIQAEDFPDEF